jgi:hypothetical protein
MGGRFFWSSASDYLGRKNTYFIFFLIGAGLYALVPNLGMAGQMAGFVLLYALIMSMYGGGLRPFRRIWRIFSAPAMSEVSMAVC